MPPTDQGAVYEQSKKHVLPKEGLEVNGCVLATQSLQPTLLDFLCELNLGEYHSAFLEAGITEMHPILQLDPTELRAFLDGLRISPFHKIVVRMGVRKLHNATQQSEVGSTHLLAIPQPPSRPAPADGTQTQPPSHKTIIEQAKFYDKKGDRSLTPYEQALNEASMKLALEDPVLLLNRGTLLQHAKAHLLETGYRYKRGGQSRSKLVQPTVGEFPATRTTRALAKSDTRQSRIQALQEMGKELGEELRNELHDLKRQERKHRWYMGKK
ncbi:hypothetical protein BC936DRAFT_143526 [Jimgerdemannia flammicorona]|uniref:SAM domain-containing protein n=1 Tax=Jimgerdemannia flammicorona TaxID=994334 RepID=A0A433DMD3_9FUNG|nr:hypothetical protein BC936DRAFT_143526 [Jimgerdemannia flammicorona]